MASQCIQLHPLGVYPMTGSEETRGSKKDIIPDLTRQRGNNIQHAKCWGGRQENNLVTEQGGGGGVPP